MRLVNRHKMRTKELFAELMKFNFKKRSPKECMQEAKKISHAVNKHMENYNGKA